MESLWLLLLLPLLLLLQPLTPALCSSAKCSLFPWQRREGFQIIFSSDMEATLRTWYTDVMAQYSPSTDQLVVLFRTPPFRDRLGKVRLSFRTKDKYELHQLVSLNDTESVSASNVTLATIPRDYLPILGSFDRLRMMLWTYANGSLVRSRVYSPMTDGCHVTVGSGVGNQARKPEGLDGSLSRLLVQRYSLAVTENCCLTGVTSTVSSPSSTQPAVSPDQTSSTLLQIGLYSFAAAASLTSLLLSIWLTRHLLAHARRFKTALKARHDEVALRRRLWKAGPPGFIARQLFGPPYQHLLEHSRSVHTRLRFAGAQPSHSAESTVA